MLTQQARLGYHKTDSIQNILCDDGGLFGAFKMKLKPTRTEASTIHDILFLSHCFDDEIETRNNRFRRSRLLRWLIWGVAGSIGRITPPAVE